MFNNFFPENRGVCEVMFKHILEPDKPQMTMWRMRFACWIYKAKDIQIINTYCFSTATVVTRTHLNVTCLYIACLIVYILSDGFYQLDRHCCAYVSLRAEFFFLKLPASVQELGLTCYSLLFFTTAPKCIRCEYYRFSVAV